MDNNLEENQVVKGLEAKYSYKKFLIYENFGDQEVDAFLETTILCSQGMTYISYGSAPADHGALFWDNQVINAINANDGICKCFVSFNCQQSGDQTRSCLNNNEFEKTTEQGQFSVKPSRLPIRAIYLGDTGHTGEWVKYSIWKLKCQFKLLTVNLKFPGVSTCLENAPPPTQFKLLDGKKDTCINYQTKYLHFELKTITKITRLQIFGKNLQEDKIDIVLYNKTKQICTREEYFIFNCEPITFLNIFAFSREKFSIELCEFEICE